jgi:methylmalonyl-CoA/ethylmalonyl-CoA epimerase
LKFDHVGLVVSEIEAGRRFLADAFQIEDWTDVFADPGIGVYVQFGWAEGGPCYELIAPLGENSPVSTALKSNKNILNHVAYLVKDIAVEGDKLRALGSMPVGAPQPAVAYGGSDVQFFISPLRFMIELIEAPRHRHAYKASRPLI